MTERPEERPEARLVDAIEDTIPLHDVLPIARAMAELSTAVRTYVEDLSDDDDQLAGEWETIVDALQALDSLSDTTGER